MPIRWAKRVYEPVLRGCSAHPGRGGARRRWLCSLACIPVALRLGGEFIPQLDEGDLVIVQTRPPSASLNEGIADATRLEKALREAFPDEIRTVVSRIGRPEIGLEAGGRQPHRHLGPAERAGGLDQGPHQGRADRRRSTALCQRVIPGTFFSFSQPIELRFNELLSGVRADLGIGIYGDDLESSRKADAIAGGAAARSRARPA